MLRGRVHRDVALAEEHDVQSCGLQVVHDLRRAEAIASQQEMKAKAQEARAMVIQAEDAIPKAMSDAFRSGNLRVMDYYKFHNIQADTRMRDSISSEEVESEIGGDEG